MLLPELGEPAAHFPLPVLVRRYDVVFSDTTGPMELCVTDELGPSQTTVCLFSTPLRGERGARDPVTSFMGEGGPFLWEPLQELELWREKG